jgi:hypothetical protein
MKLNVVTLLWGYASLTSAVITWQLQKSANPTSDQADAYAKITAAMEKAVARYTKLATRPNKSITVQYVPGVETADANFNGNLRFGSNRAYMTERTALHEIAHTLGVGQSQTYQNNCQANNWPTATKLLQSFDGATAKISCDRQHFWPYGLNYGEPRFHFIYLVEKHETTVAGSLRQAVRGRGS